VGAGRTGQRVFPAATLYVGKPDVDFWFDRANATRFNVAEKYFDEAENCQTLFRCRQGEIVFWQDSPSTRNHRASTPGHTPGHSCYVAASKGESIEFWGDIVHFASVQFPKPEITVAYDVDAAAAAQRKNSLRERKHEF